MTATDIAILFVGGMIVLGVLGPWVAFALSRSARLGHLDAEYTFYTTVCKGKNNGSQQATGREEAEEGDGGGGVG